MGPRFGYPYPRKPAARTAGCLPAAPTQPPAGATFPSVLCVAVGTGHRQLTSLGADMHPAANSLIAQSHIEDLRRAAEVSALRAEARRAAGPRLGPQPVGRNLVLRPAMFRCLVTRMA